MADEKDKNTGSNINKNLEAAKTSYQIGKDTLKMQGDYNNLLKDAQSILKKITNSYENLEARLESLNRGSINTNKINQEIIKSKQKDYILSKSLEESAKKVNAQKNNAVKDYLDIQKQILEAEGDNLEYLQSQAESMFQNLNVEEQRYIQIKQANDLSKQSIKFAQTKLESEKRINDSIGVSGRLMGILGKKLGANNEVYEDMVENARDLEKVGAKLTFFDKFKFLTKSVASSTWQAMKDPFVAIPAIGGAIAGVVGLLKSAFDYILGIQDQTVKFARAMNISTGAARQIKGEFASLSVSSGDIFINTQKMVESQMEMVDALGVTNRLSNNILAANIKLKDIAGLDLETRKGIVEASTITGQNSERLTKTILAQVVGLKQATGIQFQNQKILKEAAAQGGYLGLQFAKYPAQLTKSLLTVKAMGLELKQLDSMADSFLDFESSISKEFEAQLLTGKQINLNKARELFLNNDLAGAAAEINGQIGSSADFLKLNRIQADSLASAFGMSRDQMGEMLKQQELLARLGAKQGDNAREQLRLGLERYKNQQALTAAIGEEAYQNLVNASLQEKIAAFIEKVKQSIADFVERSGIIDKIEQFIEYISEPENIRRVVIMVRDVFAQIVDMVATIASGIISTLDFVGAISDQKAASAQAFLSGAGNRIKSLGGDFGGPLVSNNAAKGAASTGQYMGGGATTGGGGQPIEVHAHFKAEVVDSASGVQGRLNGTGYNEITKIISK